MSGPKRCKECKKDKVPDTIEFEVFPGGMVVVLRILCGYCGVRISDRAMKHLHGIKLRSAIMAERANASK
jgi:hypothetical protein